MEKKRKKVKVQSERKRKKNVKMKNRKIPMFANCYLAVLLLIVGNMSVSTKYKEEAKVINILTISVISHDNIPSLLMI